MWCIKVQGTDRSLGPKPGIKLWFHTTRVTVFWSGDIISQFRNLLEQRMLSQVAPSPIRLLQCGKKSREYAQDHPFRVEKVGTSCACIPH
jgi:hypothetical protein